MSNKVIVFSGTSGSGKSTIVNVLSSNQIVSFTTRKKRELERNGVDYLFITEEEFQELLHSDGLIEHVVYSGNRYGITKEELHNKTSTYDAYWIADYHGMKQMKKLYDNCLTIFFFCEKDDIEQRMKDRGETKEFIEKRLSTYADENLNLHHYDHVVNTSANTLEETLEIVKDIIDGGYE